MISDLQKDLQKAANPSKAAALSRYFKTGHGQYGEGDVFLGITVPLQREIAKNYFGLTLEEIDALLTDPIHEYRLSALFILTTQYKKADRRKKEQIFNFYLAHTQHINNWDLIDSSAPNIVGDYLLDTSRDILYELARSTRIWEKRIAIIATYRFIRENQFDDTLKIAEILLHDSHDLIQKAVGWMLREVGNRNRAIEEAFLETHYSKMPRTMLRYAIEKFDQSKRDYYMRRLP